MPAGAGQVSRRALAGLARYQRQFALTDEFCAHRGVSLWFGRNEHNGLRCPYHGWKYDHTGQCIEVPSEPSESGYCSKIMWRTFNAEVGTSDLC